MFISPTISMIITDYFNNEISFTIDIIRDISLFSGIINLFFLFILVLGMLVEELSKGDKEK